MRDRAILHSDANCFYASVETVLNPDFRGQAIAVCGSPEERHGIVLAKSEKAKRAGVKTGMANWQASVLREKFIEAYNEFVTQRSQGDNIAALQSVVSGLKKEESELAALRMQRLITEAGFRAEQRRIKAKITELTAKINEQRSKEVTESDYTTITEFDEAKVAKFITKVIVRRWMVTFVFYNGAKITRAYSNGQAGNKPGWNKKKEVV